MATTMPVGKKKGTPIADVPQDDLFYWAKTIQQSLTDPDKQKFLAANKAQLDVIMTEIAERGLDPADVANFTPARRAATTSGATSSAPARIVSKPKADVVIAASSNVNELLAAYAKEFHLVSPASSIRALPEGCDVQFSFMTINTETETFKSDGKEKTIYPAKEVYPVDGGALALGLPALKNIAKLAQVSWDPDKSRRLDDASDPFYCHFIAVGEVRNFDGSYRTITGSVEIDCRDGSAQNADASAKNIAMVRKFVLRQAESKAKERAITDLGVKRSYTKEELQKPFAVATLVFTGRSDDPELRRMFAAKLADSMLNGTRRLYGGSAAPRQFAPAQPQGHAPPPITYAPNEPPRERVVITMDDVHNGDDLSED